LKNLGASESWLTTPRTATWKSCSGSFRKEGELLGGMETLCGFLNGDGGKVLFGETNRSGSAADAARSDA
jgi:hypothetical protein